MIQDKIKALNDLIDEGYNSIKDKVREAESGLMPLLNEILESFTRKEGRLIKDESDFKILSKVTKAVQDAINSTGYASAIQDFIPLLDDVTAASFDLLNAANVNRSIKPINMAQDKKLIIENLVNNLNAPRSIQANIEAPLKQIIYNAVNNNMDINEAKALIASQLGVDAEQGGLLSRYYNQIARDSLSQWSGTVQAKAASEYGLMDYNYIGGNKITSRPQCIRWIDVYGGLLVREVLEVELAEAQRSIGRRTNRFAGYSVYTPISLETFAIYRGGHNCDDRAIPFLATNEEVDAAIAKYNAIEGTSLVRKYDRDEDEGENAIAEEVREEIQEEIQNDQLQQVIDEKFNQAVQIANDSRQINQNYQRAKAKYKGALKRNNEAATELNRMSMMHPDYNEKREAYQPIRQKMIDAKNEMVKAKKEVDKANKKIRDILVKGREKSKLDIDFLSTNLRPVSSTIQKKAENAQDWLSRLIGYDIDEKVSFVSKKGRAGYSSRSKMIFIMSGDDMETYVHEMLHHIELTDRKRFEKVVDFLMERTKDDKLERLRNITGIQSYGYDEMAKEDKFINAYIGKFYQKPKHIVGDDGQYYYKSVSATEVLTMGGQYWYNDAINMLSEDPEFAKFVLEILMKP